MLRKLMSATIALTFLVAGLTTVSPALAWQDSNSETGTLSNSDSRSSYIPVGKTLAGEMVFAYAGGQDGSYYLRSYRVSPTGSISEPITIATSNIERLYLPDSSAVVDPAGTIHLVYQQTNWSQVGGSSNLFYTSTKDGQSWSAPIAIYQGPWANCVAGENRCGITGVSLTAAGSGNLALVYSVLTAAGAGEIYATTKAPGKAWLRPSKIASSAFNVYETKLVFTGKGLLATWTVASQPLTYMSSYSTSLSARSWTAAQQRLQSDSSQAWKLLQIASTKFALVYATETEPYAGKLWMQVFDSKTNRFGAAQEVANLAGNVFAPVVLSTRYVAGQSAIVFSEEPQSGGSIARYVMFRNGVATAHRLNSELPNPNFSAQNPQGAVMDASGHLTIVWAHAANRDEGGTRMYVSQIFRGNRSDAEVTMPDQLISTYRVGFSIDGDIYISNFWMSTISAKVRLRSDAPSLESNVSVAGAPKVGKSVAVKLPKITASVSGQKWINSYQWYSCQFQVTEVTSIPTNDCNLISGAVSSSYKAKSSDKGRFLQVRLSVRSDNATQVQFSASTSVVK